MSSQLVLQPDAAAGIDTYITSGSYADLNLGSVDIFNIGTTSVSKSTVYSRALLRFDLTVIPASATIAGAVLTLFHESSASLSLPAQFSVYRLTRPTWTEFGATWNRYDGSALWTAAGGDYATADHDTTTVNSYGSNLVFANLNNLTADAIQNRGGFLNLLVVGPESGPSNDFLVVRSSDHADSNTRPRLVVDYTVPIPPIPNFTGGMQQLTGNLGA